MKLLPNQGHKDIVMVIFLQWVILTIHFDSFGLWCEARVHVCLCLQVYPTFVNIIYKQQSSTDLL